MIPQPTVPALRRVVVTGMGAITPSGLDVANMWASVLAGRSAIRTLEDPEFTSLPVRIGGQVLGFDATKWLARSLAKRLSPIQQWAVAAADEAMRQAGVLSAVSPGVRSSAPAGNDDGARAAGVADSWPPLPWPRERFAIIAATGSGPVDAMREATRALDSRGAHAVSPRLATYGAPDAEAALLSRRYGAFGPSQGVCATCASGAMGLGLALRSIRHGYADAVLVVGMEDCLEPVHLASNARMRALASGYEGRPHEACRPFDRGRTGFVMSAGACAMLLEADDALLARCDAGKSATVMALAELAGFGASSDAYDATAPRPDGAGAAQAIVACLADAAHEANAVDHINAHGTGTRLGDAAEIAAFNTVFGAHGRKIPISATKSTTGHLLGASGVAEAIIAVETLRSGLLPPTLNLTDPEFSDWDIVTGRARQAGVATVLSISFGFGGHNGAILLRHWSREGTR